MLVETLTAAEWRMIFSLPADGETYHVEWVAYRAKHLPATRMKCEQVICETRYGTLRRRCINGIWKPTEHVSGF